MIGLPTATRSSTSSRSTPASSVSRPTRSSTADLHGVGELHPPLRVHHHVRDPAHQVLAEADLRVHRPGGGEHLARAELAQVAGDGRRPDVDRDAVGDVHEPRPDRDQVVAAVDGDRDGVPAGGECGLEVDEHPRVDREAVERPLRGERVEQQPQVAAALARARPGRPRRSGGARPGRRRGRSGPRPCGRPGGGPGSRPGRRSRRPRGCAPRSPAARPRPAAGGRGSRAPSRRRGRGGRGTR